MNTPPHQRILLPPPRPRALWHQAFLPTWVAVRHAAQLLAFGRAQKPVRHLVPTLHPRTLKGSSGWSSASRLAPAT